MKALENDKFEIRVQDLKLAAMRGDHSGEASRDTKKNLFL